MPYKDDDDKRIYYRGYYAGWRRATIAHLGGKCQVCGSTRGLELHHKNPLNRKARNISDLRDISKLQLLCKHCHNDRKTRY